MVEGNFQTLLVANPQSANGALGRRWSELEQVIRKNFGVFDHHMTAAPGDATRVTRDALARGVEMVVAMGGDGTISEVADGFFDEDGPACGQAVLGILPFGTGGDFRKTVRAPRGLAAGARSLRGKTTWQIDAGRLTYTCPDGARGLRRFINITSFGIGGLVDQLVNNTTKVFGGRVSFALAALRALRRFSPQRAVVQLDDQEPRQVTLQNVAVANGRYFGGGMKVAPNAELDDGLFDVITIEPAPVLEAILDGRHIYRGTHLSLPYVHEARASKITARPVDPDEAILLDVDGETPGRLPATFELEAGALRLKMPG